MGNAIREGMSDEKVGEKEKKELGEKFRHTGFGRSLEGEQVWPPKTVKVREWKQSVEGEFTENEH